MSLQIIFIIKLDCAVCSKSIFTHSRSTYVILLKRGSEGTRFLKFQLYHMVIISRFSLMYLMSSILASDLIYSYAVVCGVT